MNEKKPRILLVDDERQVTKGLGMVLRRNFEVISASSGAEALERLSDSGPFEVIVSDMRMPGMNGAELLAAASEIAPAATRVMLSGQADLDVVLSAINDGHVFRFLQKPASPTEVRTVLAAAVAHHRARASIDEATDRRGIVDGLVHCLGMVHPVVAAQTHRIEGIVASLVEELGLQETEDVLDAASLSLLGTLALEAPLVGHAALGSLRDRDQKKWATHPSEGAAVLAHIDGFERIASMIRQQRDSVPDEVAQLPVEEWDLAVLGAAVVHLAKELLFELPKHPDAHFALKALRERGEHPAALLRALGRIPLDDGSGEQLSVRADALVPGMVLEQDLVAESGTVVAVRGSRVNHSLIAFVRNYSRSSAIREPLLVRLPTLRAEEESSAEERPSS